MATAVLVNLPIPCGYNRAMSLDLSPEEFLRLAERTARLASDYLALLDREAIQPAATGAELASALGGDAPAQGRGDTVLDLLQTVVNGSRAQNGRFLGYVMGSGEPAGAVADLLVSVCAP